jgi:serine/threonine-protein kinase
MTPSVSISRTLSLRAPIANETERSHFQERLALTCFVVFLIGFAASVLELLALAFVLEVNLSTYLARKAVPLQLATTFVALIGSMVLRKTRLSARALGAADVLLTVGICLGWGLMTVTEHPLIGHEARIELTPLLAASFTLATRAALVPSTPARSAFSGLLAMAPLLPITYLHRRAAIPAQDPFGPTLYVAFWAAVGIACTSTITTVIYGLRIEVRKAMELGQYVLEEKLGEGGMGVVYRASHKLLRRPCAIKLLTGTDRDAAHRFEREVRITAHLTHPNTISVFDYGHTPDGTFYYAMEYLDGTTLEQLVADFGPQSASRVVHILVQVCGVLEEAHAYGLVHRDIKPANIMLTERGLVPDVVKVLDFGLVKQIKAMGPGLSNVNVLLGTPHYMAPEAILEPGKVDGRTDLYALGATAYFLLTGRHVFHGGNVVDIASQHVHELPAPPSAKVSGIPASLDAVVLACLAKRQEDRPTDATTLAKMLLECEVDEWTRDDAREWWQQPRAVAVSQARSIARLETRVGTDRELSDTVTIELDDRGVS